MKKNRELEGFSISFLDVITCGFGAVILLLMISRNGAPIVLEPVPGPKPGIVADLQQQLFEIRGQARILNRDLTSTQEQLSQWKDKVARLSSELSSLENQESAARHEASAQAARKGELEQAVQSLTAEMKRLLAQRKTVKSDLVGGIPVDSEYVIFVIDTSGSMFDYAWGRAMEELIQVLSVYPKVKGIQVMNDMGTYMFPDYRRQWIPDSPARRRIILDRMRSWNPFSNSSPVEGIEQAIRDFYDPDKKVSIYYFGDDFNGESAQRVLDTVSRLNPRNSDGVPMMRVHCVGFPTQFFNEQEQITGVRFANLMRELTYENMGTFVGLDDFRGGPTSLNFTFP